MEKFSWVCRLCFYSLRSSRERTAGQRKAGTKAGTFQDWIDMRRDTVKQLDEVGFVSGRKPEDRKAIEEQDFRCPLDGASLEDPCFHDLPAVKERYICEPCKKHFRDNPKLRRDPWKSLRQRELAHLRTPVPGRERSPVLTVLKRVRVDQPLQAELLEVAVVSLVTLAQILCSSAVQSIWCCIGCPLAVLQPAWCSLPFGISMQCLCRRRQF